MTLTGLPGAPLIGLVDILPVAQTGVAVYHIIPEASSRMAMSPNTYRIAGYPGHFKSRRSNP